MARGLAGLKLQKTFVESTAAANKLRSDLVRKDQSYRVVFTTLISPTSTRR